MRERYLREYVPRAVRVAAELRARGDGPQLRWTVGSWILHEALEDEARRGAHEVERAVEVGDLCWHVLPFTLHTEFCDRSLFEHGLRLSARLDERFGHRTRAAKATDVPGHTRGIVSALAGVGVGFLHIGVNPASATPDVPRLFRWIDPAGARPAGSGPAELVVMYQAGSYGDVQRLPGTRTAVAVDLTGDNLGPPQLAEVVELWATLQARFPQAELVAASFDDVADAVAEIPRELPVVTAEIGDTWLHGVGSDPAKVAAYRALARTRREWLASGRATAEEPAVAAASNLLLLVAEHTWGMDQKTHWPDEEHWSAAQLAEVRSDPATVRFESSWAEQRAYLQRFVAALRTCGRVDLAAHAGSVLAGLEVVPPEVGDLDALRDPNEIVRGRGVELALGPDGSVQHLVDHAGALRATPSAPLGGLVVQTFDAAELTRRFRSYNRGTLPEDRWWAVWDFTKPGLERSGACAARWPARLRRAWCGERAEQLVVVAELEIVDELGGPVDGAPVAVPAQLFQQIVVGRGEDGATRVELDLRWFDLPAARWPVAWWWQVAPLVADPSGWRMRVFDESVDPHDVVDHGGRGLHSADRLRHDGEGLELELVDTALVSPGAPDLIEVLDRDVDLTAGWHVLLHDNLWGTNFPMWTEGAGRARVRLRCTAG